MVINILSPVFNVKPQKVFTLKFKPEGGLLRQTSGLLSLTLLYFQAIIYLHP
jgi:hypothetical protein